MLHVCRNNDERSESNRAIPGMKPGNSRNEIETEPLPDPNRATPRTRTEPLPGLKPSHSRTKPSHTETEPLPDPNRVTTTR